MQAPVPVFSVGLSGPVFAWLRKLIPLLRYGYTPHLTHWLTKNADHYDAVIVNGLWNYASFGAWRALRKSSTPYFVFTHGMLDPWFNRAYPIKTVFKTIHWKLFEHRVLRDAALVLFTTEEERALARRSFAPYHAQELVVGYGTHDIGGHPETQIATFSATCPAAKNRKLILFLSRIHEKKGVDLLIDAFARIAGEYTDFDLVVAGPDQVGLQAQLESLAAKRGVATRIHWPGMLTGDAKWGAFRAAEFFVLPSHQENFGIVVAEAMASSRPVLITDKVNIWREIEADDAGIVVNDETAAIESGLRRLCSMNTKEREAMGERARKSFLARYAIENNAMSLLAMIQNFTQGETERQASCDRNEYTRLPSR